MSRHAGILVLCGVLAIGGAALAGPYSAPTGDANNPHDPGVPGFVGPDGDGNVTANNYLNPALVAWATSVAAYCPAPGVDAAWSVSSKGLGAVTGVHTDVVSLGDLNQSQLDSGASPGCITLGFAESICDGAGADFAVFENGFAGSGTYIFAELAYVEVSTDGTAFARFPGVSLTPAAVGAYDPLDATNIYNLAGKHANASGSGYSGKSWGTPFDLSDLAGDPNVLAGRIRLNDIRYVRIVDIPGSGAFRDAADPNHPVYDPWVTWGSGGFDLEAVGVLHQAPEPATLAILAFGVLAALRRRRAG